MTDVQYLPEFKNDIKKLRRKYRHIEEDVATCLKALLVELPNHLRGTIRISGLGAEVKTPIYKVKHFRSRDLKGKGSRSGLRVIYAYEGSENSGKATLIEIYYHVNEETKQDDKRIKKYFGT